MEVDIKYLDQECPQVLMTLDHNQYNFHGDPQISSLLIRKLIESLSQPIFPSGVQEYLYLQYGQLLIQIGNIHM